MPRTIPGMVTALWLFSLLSFSSQAVPGDAVGPALGERSFVYYRDVVSEVPWSVHVVKISRRAGDIQLHTTFGLGRTLGMATLSDQLRTLPSHLGRPIAAVNGDFYHDNPNYRGRPRDLQIRDFELISSPAGHACFWVDPNGNPRITNVVSRFHLLWHDQSPIPVGLNEYRKSDAAVIYSPVVGGSTRARGGTEWFLDPLPESTPLPLRVGETYTFRLRAARSSGNSPVPTNSLVLSVGSSLARTLAPVPRHATNLVVSLLTETLPELQNIRTAVGGGPTLVRDRKVMEWSNLIQIRHPRSAIGYNEDFIYLVEVDGRQANLSVGMTFPELARYMEKLGCDQAMNLDGGGSATFWVLGEVVNSPSEGQERPGANTIVVVKKPQSP